jgi:hypothetical protein
MFRKMLVCPKKFLDPQNGTLTEIFLATGGGRSSKIILSEKNFLSVNFTLTLFKPPRYGPDGLHVKDKRVRVFSNYYLWAA